MAQFEKGQLARHVSLGVVKVAGVHIRRDCMGELIKTMYEVTQESEPDMRGIVRVTSTLCEKGELEPIRGADVIQILRDENDALRAELKRLAADEAAG